MEDVFFFSPVVEEVAYLYLFLWCESAASTPFRFLLYCVYCVFCIVSNDQRPDTPMTLGLSLKMYPKLYILIFAEGTTKESHVRFA